MSTEQSAPPTFDVLPLSADLRRALDELGYTHPTPVQRAVFEPASRGQDLVVQARTGTGKTAAFGMPLVDSLVKRSSPTVQALVLCPTRELAVQVTRELEALAKYRGVRPVPIYGGAPMPRQVQQIREGAQIVVGTPGRVLDHLERRTMDPGTIRALVLDESDEMLSMGFLPQITQILSYLPEQHQTLLFSATLPPDISRIAETRLRSPEFITLSGDHVGALEIQHFVYVCSADKVRALLQVIETEDPENAIVFCNTRDETKRVANALQQQGYAADWLNADLAQSDREKVMAATRSGQVRFLVCTDVAARGIDISHLTHVINHDFPESAESYVHRTGRTGRAGRTGTAISLIEPSDIGNLYLLRLTYKIRPIERQLPSDRELKTRAEADLVRLFVDYFAARTAHPDDLQLARRLLSHEQADIIIAGLLRDHLGARPDAAEEATAARRARAPRAAEARSVEARSEGRSSEPRSERRGREGRSEARNLEPRGEARNLEPRSEARNLEPRSEARPVPASSPAKGSEVEEPEAALGAEVPADGEPDPERRERREPRPRRRGRRAAPIAPEPTAEGGAAPPGDVVEVYVNVGQRDGATEDDLRSLLEERAGVGAEDADYVHVRNRHSFVGVRRELLGRVIEALNGAMIAGKQATAEEARPRV